MSVDPAEDLAVFRRHIAYARRKLSPALRVAQTVPFSEDHQELLRHSVAEVRALADKLAEVLGDDR